MQETWHNKGTFYCEFKDLLGKHVLDVKGGHSGSGEIEIICKEGTFTLYHQQDCCESVYVESVVGDWSDLIGQEILLAEESVNDKPPSGIEREYEPESETWTFYKLASFKGYVDIRWYGSSNGYYSERVAVIFKPTGE